VFGATQHGPSGNRDEREDHINALRERVDYLTSRERELKTALETAEAELARREAETQTIVDEATRSRDQRVAALEDDVRALNRTIRMMQATRVWQLGERYRQLRDTVKRFLQGS